MMKKLILIPMCLLALPVFADDSDDDYFEDMDSLFERTIDTIVEDSALNLKDKTEQLSNMVSQAFKIPIKFSGSLDAQLGFLYWPLTKGKSVYFDFDNHYAVTAFPKDYLSVTSNFKIAYNNGFKAEVYQIYFDYVPFSHLFIDGGKRGRSLTVAKIFTRDTNFLSDSAESMSGSITFSVGSFSMSAKALYHIAFIDPGAEYAEQTVQSQISQAENDAKLLNYVFNMEFIVLRTNVNLFFRKWQSSFKSANGNTDLSLFKNYFYYSGSYPASGPESPQWTWGIQLRKTIFGADCYFQGTLNFNPFREDFKRENFHGIQLVTGLYKYWDYEKAKFGFNAEYHYLFDDREGIAPKSEFGLTGGISKLADNHLALVATWTHDYERDGGAFTPGVIISNVFKGSKIQIGMNIAYQNGFDTAISGGVKLDLSISY